MPPASPSPSGGAGSSLYPTRGERVGVRGNYPGQRSRLVDGEALVGVEDPALDIGGLGGPPPELVHAAHQAHPIQDLLLAAVLDGTQRPLPPRRIIAGLKRVVEGAVGFDVGVEQMVLAGQKCMRPARGSDQRDPPRALLDDPGAG